jgi:hypothetical protein
LFSRTAAASEPAVGRQISERRVLKGEREKEGRGRESGRGSRGKRGAGISVLPRRDDETKDEGKDSIFVHL